MKADYEFDITDLDLIVSQDGKGLMLRAQTVDQPPTGPRRSGKYIHLSLTPSQAMRLLGHLQRAQAHFGYPDVADAETVKVPPRKDQN